MDTSTSYKSLKSRQRAERDNYPEHLSLRVHRALSWLNRAEQCDDDDGRFIFLWVAFNAAYANETGEIRIAEGRRVSDFLSRLVDLDTNHSLANIVWNNYSGSIRLLLDNRYVYAPFWDHQNGLPNSDDWQQRFENDKRASHKALGIVFSRLYTLRNQLIHGGATFGGSVNRKQLHDAARILGDVVPLIIEIMMDNSQQHWGEAVYPVKA